jgi:hypothetical protein
LADPGPTAVGSSFPANAACPGIARFDLLSPCPGLWPSSVDARGHRLPAAHEAKRGAQGPSAAGTPAASPGKSTRPLATFRASPWRALADWPDATRPASLSTPTQRTRRRAADPALPLPCVRTPERCRPKRARAPNPWCPQAAFQGRCGARRSQDRSATKQ